MKQDYKITEIFDEKSNDITEKLNEVFMSFLIEKLNNVK